MYFPEGLSPLQGKRQIPVTKGRGGAGRLKKAACSGSGCFLVQECCFVPPLQSKFDDLDGLLLNHGIHLGQV